LQQVTGVSGKSVMLALALVFLHAPAFGQGTASIQGTIQAQGGGVIAGAIVSYGLMAPPRNKAPAAMLPPIQRVSSGSDGAFSIHGLNAGAYLVCVSVVNQPFLDPCHWSPTPVTFTVTNGQAITKATIQLVKGQVYPIRVNDPLQSFSNEGKSPGANLTMMVRSYSGAIHAAVVASSDATGRNYTLTIPFDTPLNLMILPGAFNLSDNHGLAVASTGGQFQITAPSAGTTPPTTFTLNGIGKP
jgi:hypothetical protein